MARKYKRLGIDVDADKWDKIVSDRQKALDKAVKAVRKLVKAVPDA
jgi:hypothetical protein